MKKILKIFLLLLVVTLSSQVAIARDFGIIAVVNNDVVTNYELQSRISLALGASGIKDTPSNRGRMALQTLEQIIDEKLQKQEAEKRHISISEEELNRSIDNLVQQNGLKPGEFDKFIKRHNIDKDAFLIQIKSQLLWQKILLRVIKPKVYISPNEVADFIDRLMRNEDGSELFISEILIPVAVPKQEEDAKKLANKLVDELKSGGDFKKFARQFSRSNTAKNNGTIGWVPESDLEDKLRRAISGLEKGENTKAIRTGAGYLIIKVNDKRLVKDKQPPEESKVMVFLSNQKMELDARKFMKNLRRQAYIERRI
jgi:peptidyl-prolyl cis-trans isomerase SurA